MTAEQQQQVYEIIADVSGFDMTDIAESDTLAGELELDSLDLVNLGKEIEGRLSVEIPDSAVSASMTVRQLVEAIDKLL